MSMVIQQKIGVSNIKNPYLIRVFYDIIIDKVAIKLSYNKTAKGFLLTSSNLVRNTRNHCNYLLF